MSAHTGQVKAITVAALLYNSNSTTNKKFVLKNMHRDSWFGDK
jgi:hypothetical protein